MKPDCWQVLKGNCFGVSNSTPSQKRDEAIPFYFGGEMLTKEFLEDQIVKLSDERKKARLRLAEVRIELDRAEKAQQEAFELLDRLDDCVEGLIRELNGGGQRTAHE
jgi:hypothetical protein